MKFFLIFLMFAIGCEELDDELWGEPQEPFTECENGRTQCNFAKEFVELCENGFWHRHTDCAYQNKTCFLFEGAAECKPDDNSIKVVK